MSIFPIVTGELPASIYVDGMIYLDMCASTCSIHPTASQPSCCSKYVDMYQGLDLLRSKWIEARSDVKEYSDIEGRGVRNSFVDGNKADAGISDPRPPRRRQEWC